MIRFLTLSKQTVIILIVTLCCSQVAGATVYTWVDQSGVRHYSGQPAGPNAQKAHLSKLQKVQSNGSALKFAHELEAKKKKEKREKARKQRIKAIRHSNAKQRKGHRHTTHRQRSSNHAKQMINSRRLVRRLRRARRENHHRHNGKQSNNGQ